MFGFLTEGNVVGEGVEMDGSAAEAEAASPGMEGPAPGGVASFGVSLDEMDLSDLSTSL